MWDQIWDKIFDNSCEIVLVLFLAYLLWRMTADIIGMINYYRADVYTGQVIKSLGIVKEATYISGHSPCYQTFEKYECNAYQCCRSHSSGSLFCIRI